ISITFVKRYFWTVRNPSVAILNLSVSLLVRSIKVSTNDFWLSISTNIPFLPDSIMFLGPVGQLYDIIGSPEACASNKTIGKHSSDDVIRYIPLPLIISGKLFTRS